MKVPFEKQFVYTFSDEEIMSEISRRIKNLRQSCCFSQQEFADLSGVSLITIKRIESGSFINIGLLTIIKILRAGGALDGIADLVEDVPMSPFVIQKGNTTRKHFSSNMKQK